MLETTMEQVLLKTKQGFKVAYIAVDPTDDLIYAQLGQNYHRLCEGGRTSNESISWTKMTIETKVGNYGRLQRV